MNHHNATKEQNSITVLGIDLAKQSFQLHGVDMEGNVLLNKKLKRHLNIFMTSCVAFNSGEPGCREKVVYNYSLKLVEAYG